MLTLDGRPRELLEIPGSVNLMGVAVDEPCGRVYVADYSRSVVHVLRVGQAREGRVAVGCALGGCDLAELAPPEAEVLADGGGGEPEETAPEPAAGNSSTSGSDGEDGGEEDSPRAIE